MVNPSPFGVRLLRNTVVIHIERRWYEILRFGIAASLMWDMTQQHKEKDRGLAAEPSLTSNLYIIILMYLVSESFVPLLE